MTAYPYTGLMSVYISEQPQLLQCALESILNQDYQPIKFVLVKDGQLTNELISVINEAHKAFERVGIPFVELQNAHNLGLGRSLNKGLRECSTELVARFDSDDINLPQRMIKTVQWFDQHPDTAIVGTQIYEFDQDMQQPFDIKHVPVGYQRIKKVSSIRNPFNHMSVTFKKSVIEDVGGYVDVPLFEDYYLWLRVLHAKYLVENLKDVLVKAHVNQEFAHKRGGIHYFKKELYFQNLLVHEGLLKQSQYVRNIITRGFARLLPSRMLLNIYKCLRKKSNN